MRLNTQRHRWLGCPLALHKIQINPVSTSAEACDFCHGQLKSLSPHFSRLTKHDQDSEPNFGSYKSLFGTWNNAKESAGLSPCSTGPEGPSKEDCVRALRKVANELGKSPTRREYNEAASDSDISAANISYQFPTWNEAKKEAGLTIPDKVGWTEEEVINSVSRAVERQRDTLTKRDYMDLKRPEDPSVYTVSDVCGSWNSAVEKVGNTPHTAQYTEEDCIEALQFVTTKLGKSPTKREYDEHRREADPHPWVMKNSFESWNYMKQIADLEIYDDGSYIQYPYGSNWHRTADQVRSRDNHICQRCGITSKEHNQEYGTDLEVHHLYKITSFLKGLPDELTQKLRSNENLTKHERAKLERHTQRANDATNLITVCIPCHSELESRSIEYQTDELDIDVPEVRPE